VVSGYALRDHLDNNVMLKDIFCFNVLPETWVTDCSPEWVVDGFKSAFRSVDLLDTDHLSGKDLTEIDLAPPKADTAAGGDDDALVVDGIIELRQAPTSPGGRGMEGGGRLLAPRLVRLLGVEFVDEFVELRLLLQDAGAGRLGRLKLQRRVHAFMPAALLRFAWLDPSMPIPSLSHHTDNFERLNSALGEAKRTP
jgi:hypothetical protein